MAEYSKRLHTSRRIRILRDLELDRVRVDITLHARNKGQDARRVGSGILSADETPCRLGTEANTVFL